MSKTEFRPSSITRKSPMCYQNPRVFPTVLSSDVMEIDVLDALATWIPAFVTGSFHHIPLWLDRDFEYYDVYDVRVVGLHRYYNGYNDIVWDVVLVITLVSGRFYFLRMPMLNNRIREWNNINFYDIFRNLVIHNANSLVTDALLHEGYSCNTFMYCEGCDTFVVPRRTLDDYLLVPEEPHVRAMNVMALT